MKKLTMKKWFQESKTQYDLRVDLDGLYAFKAMKTFEVQIEKETEKALLIKLQNCMDSILNGKILWVPKSVVQFLGE